MKYAVIDLGGKQFMVEEGTKFHMEFKDALEPRVLFYRDGESIFVGQPEVSGVSVKLSKEKDYTQKTDILRFKSKSRYRRAKGHKQPMSVLVVAKISLKEEVK